MKKIVQLSQDSSHLLHSTNIITSVFSVVKELIENALDAHAKVVEIKLENSGLDRIDVRDDGMGVSKEDVQFLAKPHYTSKISKYADLAEISSYGFRGEALGAICAVGELSITTRTALDEVSTTYNFLKNGDVSSSKLCASQSGTTVTIKDLFKNIPVRRKYYKCEKHKRDELKKIEDILCAFSCAHIGTRFALYNNHNLIWQKSPATEMRAVLIQIFGNAAYLNLENKVKEYDEEMVKIEAYVPKKSSVSTVSRSCNDRCLILVNKRPVSVKSIEKLLQDIYFSEEAHGPKRRFPICLIDISLPPPNVDVNVDPSKQKIFFHDSESILNMLSDTLSEIKECEIQHAFSNSERREELGVHLNKPLASTAVTSEIDQSKISMRKECDKEIHCAIADKSVEQISSTSEYTLIPISADKQTCNRVSLFDKNNVKSTAERVLLPVSSGTHNQCSNVLNNRLNGHHQSNLFDSAAVQNKAVNFRCPVSVHDSEANRPKNIASGTPVDHQDSLRSFYVSSASKKFDVQERSEVPLAVTDCISSASKEFDAPERNRVPLIITDHINSSSKEFDVQEKNNVPSIVTDQKKPVSEDSNKFNRNENHLSSMCNGKANKRDLSSFFDRSDLQPVAVYAPSSSKRKSGSVVNEREESNKKQKFQTHLRPMTAFDYFCYEKRLEVISQKSPISNQEIARILAEKWRLMPENEKSAYEQKVSKQPQRLELKRKSSPPSINAPKKTIQSPSSIAHHKKQNQDDKDEQCEVISFHFDKIASFLKSFKSRHKNPEVANEALMPISSISCGVWVCRENEQLILLNTYRIRETLIYHRLMATFHFEANMLSKPILITEETLGDSETYHVLLMLCISESGQFLMNQHITANGFNIKVSKGAENLMAEVIGMSSILPSYSLHDLREILYLIKAKGSSATLSECRPKKVSCYLQGEAVRIARQSLPLQMKQEISNFLREASTYLPSCIDHCFHNKPFKEKVFDTNQLQGM